MGLTPTMQYATLAQITRKHEVLTKYQVNNGSMSQTAGKINPTLNQSLMFAGLVQCRRVSRWLNFEGTLGQCVFSEI